MPVFRRSTLLSLSYPINGCTATNSDRKWESELLCEENLGASLDESVDEIVKYFTRASRLE